MMAWAPAGLFALVLLAPAWESSALCGSMQGGRADEEARVIAVLIQERLGDDASTDIEAIRRYVTRLPHGSRVMVAYCTPTGLRLDQEFTPDLGRAAAAITTPYDGDSYTPNFFLYKQMSAAFESFDTQPEGRRTAIVLSDGLNRGIDTDTPQGRSLDLNEAIAVAQKRRIRVVSVYHPSLATSYNRSLVNIGLNALTKLAEETGGQLLHDGFDSSLVERFAPSGRTPLRIENRLENSDLGLWDLPHSSARVRPSPHPDARPRTDEQGLRAPDIRVRPPRQRTDAVWRATCCRNGCMAPGTIVRTGCMSSCPAQWPRVRPGRTPWTRMEVSP